MGCTSGEASSHSGSVELDDLLLSKLIELIRGESSERVFIESLFFFLDGCHCGQEYFILNIYNI